MIAWQINEHYDRLEVHMHNGLGRFSPLRDEHGRIVDFMFEHRHQGGQFTETSINAFVARFERVDAIFRNWGRK